MDDLSRTEPPSPRRRAEARRAGDVPRSALFVQWAQLAALTGVFAMLGGLMLDTLAQALAASLTRAASAGPDALVTAFDVTLDASLFNTVFAVVGLPLLALLLAGLVAPIVYSGWVWCPGRKRAGRGNSAFSEAGYAVFRVSLKLLIAGGVSVLAWQALPPHALGASAAQLTPFAAQALLDAWLGLLVALAGLAVIDAAWNAWRWWKRHAMSVRDLEAEASEGEARPEVRAALRTRRASSRSGAKA